MSEAAPTGKGTPGNWDRMLQEISSLSQIPNMTIPRLLRLLSVALIHESHSPAKNPFNAALKKVGLREYRNGGPIFRAVTINNAYALLPTHLHNEIVVPTVADLVDDQTEAVVELGCGFGRHMFALRDLLEHRFPNLKFFGGELSSAGLEAARRIAALEPARRPIEFQVFDHLDPSLAFLGECRNVVFFTVHSIEQVWKIRTAFFDEMLRRDGHVRCLHAEPVGWQLNDDVMSKLDVMRDLPLPKIRLNMPVSDHYSAVIPATSGWNRDLVSTLKHLEGGRRIRIEYIEPNVAGDEIYNPTTHILWTKV